MNAAAESNLTIRPKFVACRIDVSEFCSPEFLDRCGGKVYLSGFFDDNLNTFICSAEKMLFVHALGYVPENYPEDEALADALNNELLMESPEDDYFSRSTIERLRREDPDSFEDLEDVYDVEDEVREYLQGNPRF